MKKRTFFIVILIAGALLFGAYALFGAAVINAFTTRAAKQAMEAGDNDRAAMLYDEVLERDPRNETLRLLVCDLYRAAGNFSRAEHTLLSGLQNDGAGVELYKKLSALFVEQDKLYDAVELIDGIRISSVRDELLAARPAPPVFSHSGGVYEKRINVSLSAEEGNLVYVSSGGDYPSVMTGLYTDPIAMEPGTTQLIAAAVDANGLVSGWAKAEYRLENIIDPITFVDPAMEAVLRKTINKPEGQIFTNDLWDIEELVFDKEAGDYRTLEDLRHCPRLHTLKLLGTHTPCDISVLPSLEKLTVLSLDSLGLDSIMLKWIAPCTGMESLYLPNNGIGPVSSLSELGKLTILDLSFNSILDLTPLSTMAKLQYLDLSQNAIEDPSPLSSLKDLRTLLLDRNRLTSLKGLASLTHLETLELSYNSRMNSLDEIANLTSLAKLNASNCQLGALPKLSGLTALRELSLASNGITDIEGLRDIKSLRTLTISHNSISSLSPLSGLSALETLNASDNVIGSIDPLKDLSALNSLSIENNGIKTLIPLKGCPSLKNVYAFGNSISDPLNTWEGSGVTVRWLKA